MTRAFETCIKLADLDGQPVQYPHVYWREQTSGPERLVLAPRGSSVEVMRRLSRELRDPAFLLYVLRVPRRGHEPGRYQSPGLLDPAARDEFLHEFGEFFDRDGRHQLWIGVPEMAMLVWDEHQWIYAYGPLDVFEQVATDLGLRPGTTSIPSPHAHNYHELFDDTEDEIIDRFNWIYTPDPED